MATSNHGSNKSNSNDQFVPERKGNNFDTIDLSRYETGFFEPELNFDSLDNIITETVEIPIESADAQNNQNLHQTQSSTRLNAIEEQVLSQKMSQLSTKMTHDQDPMMKLLEKEMKKIPLYLTKKNESFKQLIDQVLLTGKVPTSNKNREAFRNMALLIYRILFIQIYFDLWTTYLKSGLGQLFNQLEEQTTYPKNFQIWPKDVKQIIQQFVNLHEGNENDICQRFIRNYLSNLDNQLKQYEVELNKRKDNFPSYTSLGIQKLIETYIKQNFSPIQMEIEHHTELIKYNYHIRALKFQYYQNNPNEYQKNLMKKLCSSKYAQETAEQEVNLLQQKINYYNSPAQSFESSTLAQVTLINSVQDATIRQQLFNRYKEITEKAKAKIFALYMKTAEDQRDEFHQKYEADVKKMWSDRRSFPENEKIPLIMIELIEQRCKKISERIQCIYKFKFLTLHIN